MADVPVSTAGWSIWTSGQDDATTWWATRTRLLTESEMHCGLVHTLRASTEAGLHALLDEQATRVTETPAPAIGVTP